METACLDPHVRKRRCSLFALKRKNDDIGEYVLTHAHCPRSRSHSLPITRKPSNSTFPKRFRKEAFRDIMKDVLDKGLKDKLWNENECAKQSHDLAQEIKSRIFNLRVPHFKFIVTCHLTRNFDNSMMNIQSGCLWDQDRTSVDRDIFAEYVFVSDEIIAIGSVHGIYTRGFNNNKSIQSLKVTFI